MSAAETSRNTAETPAVQPEPASPACAAAAQGAFPASPAVEEEVWEYKPVVKYTAAGLLAAAALAFSASMYWLGHRQGFAAGVESDLVAEKLNAAAASNLAHFLQLRAADDAELLAQAAAPEQEFGWIQNPDIRREAQWQLVAVLVERGLMDAAAPLLDPLFAAQPQQEQWAPRAMQVGDAYLSARRPQEAAAWYHRAAEAYAAQQRAAQQYHALQHEAAALCADSAHVTPEALAALVQGLPAGAETRSLRTLVALQRARLLSNRDAKAAAAERAALADELLPGGTPAADLSPVERIMAGMALAEQGQDASAWNLLTEGEAALGTAPCDVLCRMEALRRLASLTMQRTGKVHDALALLNRAEGMAACLLPAQHPFCTCLAEQRGWLQLLMQDEEGALASFRSASQGSQDVTVTLQAMEGEGRCLLALSRTEEAEAVLTRCAEMRRRLTPADVAALGRVTLLLAQAQDHLSRIDAAAESYGTAAALLQQAGDAESANYLTALLGHGYALVQQREWAEGLRVWEAVMPLVKDIPDRRQEARTLLNECRRHNRLPSADAAPHDPQATAEAAAADAAAEAEDEDEEENAAAH